MSHSTENLKFHYKIFKLKNQDDFFKANCIHLMVYMYSRSKKKETTLFISTQIIVQKWNWYQSSWIIVCLLQFDALKFFLGVRLHGGSLPNFTFFNVNPQIFQGNHKVHLSNCLETNFHNICNISLRVIRRRNYN